jgi:hypothetical protein
MQAAQLKATRAATAGDARVQQRGFTVWMAYPR